jgi:hypothetical protein
MTSNTPPPVLRFSATGSKGDPYEIVAQRRGQHVIITCTCGAGINGTYCKHRFALIHGDVSDLASNNIEDVKALRSMITGSTLADALTEVVQAEEVAAKANRLMSAAKKRVAQAMLGHAWTTKPPTAMNLEACIEWKARICFVSALLLHRSDDHVYRGEIRPPIATAIPTSHFLSMRLKLLTSEWTARAVQ